MNVHQTALKLNYIQFPTVITIIFLFSSVLVGEIAYDLSRTNNAKISVTIITPASSIRSTKNDSGEVLSWVNLILARPLFNTDRRPSNPGGALPAKTALPRLAGVIVTPFGRQAIFATSPEGKSIAVPEGKKMGIYTITHIEAGAVTVSESHSIHQISLSFAADSNDDEKNNNKTSLDDTNHQTYSSKATSTIYDPIRDLPMILVPPTHRR